jgi:hypothetical protein
VAGDASAGLVSINLVNTGSAALQAAASDTVRSGMNKEEEGELIFITGSKARAGLQFHLPSALSFAAGREINDSGGCVFCGL